MTNIIEIRTKYDNFKESFENKIENYKNGKYKVGVGDLKFLPNKFLIGETSENEYLKICELVNFAKDIYEHNFVKTVTKYANERKVNFFDSYGIYDQSIEAISINLSRRKIENWWFGILDFRRLTMKGEYAWHYPAGVPLFKVEKDEEQYKISLYNWQSVDNGLKYIDYISKK